MGGKVEVCTGFGTKWIDVDQEGLQSREKCDVCVGVAPLSTAIKVSESALNFHRFSYDIVKSVHLIGRIQDVVKNKGPPLSIV